MSKLVRLTLIAHFTFIQEYFRYLLCPSLVKRSNFITYLTHFFDCLTQHLYPNLISEPS